MGFGVEIRNDDNKILINQAFNNLCLSRKIKASDLPIVTVSGGWLMGSFRVRQITMQADEVLAACGRSQGQSYCPYGISYGFSGSGNGNPTNKPYLFAMRRMTFYMLNNAPSVWWNNRDTHDTGISDSASVADDLYVYTFKRSTDLNLNSLDSTEKFGLQIFDENGAALFDSRVPSARVLYFGSGSFTVPDGKKIAIGTCSINMMAYALSDPAFYIGGIGIMYDSDFDKIRTASGFIRNTISQGLYGWYVPGIEYIVLDVTNF